ncbi:hypothetical protein ANN_26828 [Periplaneta americana]|uniref:DDE Tnp4 domain-containing protein n=1 Tax=Periplaneta americana TaxID=6978 RepID=A0ABQ8RZ75_PERAM|nr:hypothetical protein ANN_26828 [Periplaneta americana]
METKTLNLPSPEPLPRREVQKPYAILGDDVFALGENLMKPYPGLYLNIDFRFYIYRHSRGLRIIENIFGLMCSVFLVFRKQLLLNVQDRKRVIVAYLYLHNFLRKKMGQEENVPLQEVSTLKDRTKQLFPIMVKYNSRGDRHSRSSAIS